MAHKGAGMRMPVVDAARGVSEETAAIAAKLATLRAPRFLIINKIDLAPYVGASLQVMESDARKMRGDRPFVMANLKDQTGLPEIVQFIEREGLLHATSHSPV